MNESIPKYGKMRSLFLVMSIQFCCHILTGQITLAKESFPVMGDTLYFKTDRLPENVDILNAGENFFLDLRQLKAPYIEMVSFEPFDKIQYSDLPSSIDLIMYESNQEKYFLTISASSLEVVGSMEINPFIQDQLKYCAFQRKGTLRKAGLKYKDQGEYRSTCIMRFDQEELPLSIYQSLHRIPDSLQVIFDWEVSWIADGFGTLRLPSITDEVLKLRVHSRNTMRYQVKNQGQWTEISPTSVISGGLIPQTTIELEYLLISPDSKLPLAIIKMNQDHKVQEVRYQINQRNEGYFPPLKRSRNITAIPNPTFGDTRFEFYNYPPGKYTIEIYNIIGKKIWRNEYELGESKVIKDNFAFLKKGTYLYSFIDSNGEKITTKRLVIITP